MAQDKLNKSKPFLEFTIDVESGAVAAEGHNLTLPFGKCVDKSLDILKEALGEKNVKVQSANPKDQPPKKLRKNIQKKQELGG